MMVISPLWSFVVDDNELGVFYEAKNQLYGS